mmetsp:Transcript_94765/g.305927  ORF Transcript_94765/g.305927 Transcript_94765/m.305927 type:complete len:200 (-) Transcript_94765:374-973(-)
MPSTAQHTTRAHATSRSCARALQACTAARCRRLAACPRPSWIAFRRGPRRASTGSAPPTSTSSLTRSSSAASRTARTWAWSACRHRACHACVRPCQGSTPRHSTRSSPCSMSGSSPTAALWASTARLSSRLSSRSAPARWWQSWSRQTPASRRSGLGGSHTQPSSSRCTRVWTAMSTAPKSSASRTGCRSVVQWLPSSR